MPGLTSEPAVPQEPGQRGAVPLCQPLPAGTGLLGRPWGIRLEISAPFPSVGNGGPGRTRHSFAIAGRSVTCRGRAGGKAREERELVRRHPCPLRWLNALKPSLPVEGKLFFSQKECGSDAGRRRGDAALALGRV